MDLAEKLNEFLVLVAAILIGFNMIISGAISILEALKVKINQDHFIYKVIDFIQKILDLISANKKHE